MGLTPYPAKVWIRNPDLQKIDKANYPEECKNEWEDLPIQHVKKSFLRISCIRICTYVGKGTRADVLKFRVSKILHE